jgi:endonuclease/exonuclease/phosphatase family metal-dependent hydrolase
VFATREQPCQRDLRGCRAGTTRQCCETVEQAQVARERLTLEARHGATDVLRLQAVHLAQRAGEEAAPQRAEGDQRNTQFATGLEHRNFGVARPQGIFGLHGRDGMNRMGTAQGLR